MMLAVEDIRLKVGCFCLWCPGGRSNDNVAGTESVVCCRFLCLVVAAVILGTTICTAWTWTGCSGVASKTVHRLHKSLKHLICIMPKWMWCDVCVCVCVCERERERGFRSPVMSHCVIGCFVLEISRECAAFTINGQAVWEEQLFFLSCFILETEGTTIFQNIGPTCALTQCHIAVVRTSRLCMVFAFPAPKFLMSCLNLIFKVCAKKPSDEVNFSV